MLSVLSVVLFFGIAVICLNFLQKKIPEKLPSKLRDWRFLPKYFRSLEPYDKLLRRLCMCKKFKKENKYENDKNSQNEIRKSNNIQKIFILSQSNLYDLEKLKHLS